MKKLILLIAALALIYANAFTQGCLPEGITFTTQEEIDNFQANYPGCTEIEGDVIISGNGIQNLNGLSCLISFRGSLNIEWTSLIYLTGMENVQYIGDDFRIFNNTNLLSLTGLNALDSIIGSFWITSNYNLMTTSAMENLAYVGGDLWISFNEISDLAGFTNLNYIGGKLGIRYEPLESLAGLENLTYIGGGLSIEGLNLTDLTGLNNVTVISGDLLIAHTMMTSLTGLENLTAGFIENLIISDNPLLSDCQIESICEYLAAPSGVLTIARNAPGCNSVVELSLSCGGAMPCLPYGDYYFSTQTDVDSFQSAFSGCTELEGSVWFTSGITNLNGLNSVTSIQGNLGIHGTGINNLVGLGSITSIGGDLKMSGNGNLYNLLGFENLAIVNGSLLLESTHLQNLAGLESLSNVGGDILIQENFNLESLLGLDNLDSIGGSLKLYQNNSLTSLAGLQGLNIIEGNLELGKFPGCSGIGGNPLLSDLSGLNNLNTVNGDMNVKDNYSIINLEGLGNIASIGGSLSISLNNSLSSLTGLENLTSIPGGLSISNNYSLTSLTGLENLTSIPGGLSISNNNSLTSLTGLENLTSIGGNFSIYSNSALTSLTGLENLSSIGSDLEIFGNSSLSVCDAEWLCNLLLNAAGVVNIGYNAPGCNSVIDIALHCGGLPCLPYGNYEFYSQADIDNFSQAFPGCNELEGNVYIDGDDITNLNGLNQVTSIGGGLGIGGYYSSNPVLTNLTGLENLTSIGGELSIYENSALTNLTGLDNIDAGSIYNLTIRYNNSLSDCAIESVCNYLASPNCNVWIYGNALGCSSQAQVIVACETTGIEETITESGFFISPNPFAGQLSIEFNLPQASTVSIQIINAMGAKVAELHKGRMPAGQQQIVWNSGDLQRGLYICRMQVGEDAVSFKIVKQ